jgi:hypothetical protein
VPSRLQWEEIKQSSIEFVELFPGAVENESLELIPNSEWMLETIASSRGPPGNAEAENNVRGWSREVGCGIVSGGRHCGRRGVVVPWCTKIDCSPFESSLR